MRKRSQVMQSIKKNIEFSILIYCCIKEKKKESERKDFTKENKDLGTMALKNAVESLK